MTNQTTSNNTQPNQPQWLDKMTFQAGQAREKGLQRANVLRGEKAKTRETRAWADKQEVKADRQEVQLETQKIRLSEDKTKQGVAKDEMQFQSAYRLMNRVELSQKLVTKAYKIGANPDTLNTQVKAGIAPAVGEAVNFAQNYQPQTVNANSKS